MIMATKRILEETSLEFTDYAQLSYMDIGGVDVHVYIDDKKVGKAKVWLDSEEEGREYLCLNYEVVYLDTITKRQFIFNG